jgi:predicted O-methyltransferase YrrM
MMTNLFTLAENYTLPIHKICLESLKIHNPEAKIFTKELINELPGGEEFNNKFGHLSLVHYSDIFRVWYILKNGGFWIDADCLHLRTLEFPYDMSDDQVSFIYDDANYQKINQCIIYSKNPDNIFLKRLFDRQIKLVQDKGAAGLTYLDLGQWSINHIMHHENLMPFVAPHWEYGYISWYNKEWFLQQKNWDQFEYDRGLYSPNAYCYHLTNAVIDFAKNDSYEDLFNFKTFLSFLIRRAMTFGFDNTRHKSILCRMPEIQKPYNYVEIGVYEGSTSAIISQQRYNATIHCVDPWANKSSNAYKATGDYLAFSTDVQHQNHYDTFKARTWFVESQKRLKVYREESQVAVNSFVDNSMDMVFIDGDHSYEGVKRDIELWWNKVKPGMYIGGHDYDYPGLAFGVKKAVDEFVKSKNLTLELDGDWCWFVRKPL